jgi:hypothetical protein
MASTVVPRTAHSTNLLTTIDGAADAKWCCGQLEAGQILYLEKLPFSLPDEDRQFLLSQRQDARYHKNISYRPQEDKLRGFAADQPAEVERLHRILRDYSRLATAFLSKLLAPYAADWTLDFATFRPIEEKGRDLPLHKRNDLMHVDSFPSRPTRGARILRFFTNINPTEPRVWLTAERFHTLAERYAHKAGLPRYAALGSPLRRRWDGALRTMKRAIGLRAPKYSPYDRFMLRFHDFLKESRDFQQSPARVQLEFPPGATWMVFTDSVPHAVLSGRFALEQTCMIPLSAMQCPHLAPVRVLEQLCGRPLLD